MPKSKEQQTVEQTKQEVVNLLKEGNALICPCCEQLCKVYRRSITTSMVKGLEILAKYQLETKKRWVNLDDIREFSNKPHLHFGGDFAKLRYWGLIESYRAVREDGSKRTGIWSITPEAIAFLKGSPVIKYKHIYNGIVVKESGVPFTYTNASGFDFNSLLG